MKNLTLISSVLLAVFISSCHEKPKTPPTISIPQVTAERSTIPARKYVENNEFIDVHIDAKSNIDAFTDADQAKLKAAVYRFYKHVKVKDGIYVCSLKNAKEINVSENIYTTYLASLKKQNKDMEKARAKGGHLMAPEITEDYLNSLLD